MPYLMMLAAAWPDGQLGIATSRSAGQAAPPMPAANKAESAIRQIQLAVGMIAS